MEITCTCGFIYLEDLTDDGCSIFSDLETGETLTHCPDCGKELIDGQDIETVVSKATNAGFVVDACYPYIILSLKNRKVTTMEIATALDIPQSMCQRDGKSVLIVL